MPRNSFKLYFILVILSFFLLFNFSVSAQTVSAQNNGRQVAQTRLSQATLTACQAKEDRINKRMEQLEDLAANMFQKFDAIALRVEEYYASKVVSSGKTVENYNSLVADIEAKKVLVQTNLSSAKSNAGSFSCSGNDPKGQLTQFRVDMQTVKKSLKDYRTAIKNLIVAVRSVTGETQRNSVSPKPTRAGGKSY